MFLRVCLLSLIVLVAVNVAKKQKRYALRQQTCSPTEFKCTNGDCIDIIWQCDAEADCDDASDEAGCPADCTGPHEFKCNNGKCIPAIYKCDGDNDCRDGTDETGCSSG